MHVAPIALLICLSASAAIAEADLPSAPAGQASAASAAAMRSARSRAKKVAKPRKQRIDRNRGAIARQRTAPEKHSHDFRDLPPNLGIGIGL
jgi:hypothetical protein